jgi:hypothetical protein
MCHTTGPNIAGTFEGRPLTIVSRLFQGYQGVSEDNDELGPQNCPGRIKVGDNWRGIDPKPSESERGRQGRLPLNAQPIPAFIIL